MNPNKITHCTNCEEPFNDEEIETPRLDKSVDNEPICDQCYRRLYEITCPLCEDLFDDPEKWEPNQFIYAPIGVEVPGIYRVNEWPFFGGPMLGDANYFDGAIELAKPLIKEDVEEGQFICPDCIKKHQLILTT